MTNMNCCRSVAVCIVAFLIILPGTGLAGTARISPGKSIQEAIYKSQTGDAIEIQSGIYFENVVITKPLVIRGVDTGSGRPTIDAGGMGSAIELLSDGISLENLNFQGAGGWDEAGILMKSNGCAVLNCTARDNHGIGIYLFNASNNTLLNNEAFNCNFGIAFNSSSNNILKNNSMHENMCNFLAGRGFNDIDTSNKVDRRPLYYLTNKTDLIIDSSSNAGDVYCINCSNITIKYLVVDKNFAGIFFQNTTDSFILNNIFRNNSLGIFLMDSEGNRIENNTIAYNTYGIYLKSDHLNCSNNTIDQNNVSMNEYGIFLNIEGDRGQNNMIFNNILIGNKKGNAFSRGEAKWDNGSIGNLYGDYRSPADGCSDSDGNGICDSPHKIRGSSSTDKYPIFEKSKLS